MVVAACKHKEEGNDHPYYKCKSLKVTQKQILSLWKFSQALYYLLFYKCLQYLCFTLALVYQQCFTETIVLKSSKQTNSYCISLLDDFFFFAFLVKTQTTTQMITAATIAPINAPATIALSESRKKKKKEFLKSINPAKSHRNLVEDPLPERRHSIQRPKKLSVFFQERRQRYSRKKRTGLL